MKGLWQKLVGFLMIPGGSDISTAPTGNHPHTENIFRTPTPRPGRTSTVSAVSVALGNRSRDPRHAGREPCVTLMWWRSWRRSRLICRFQLRIVSSCHRAPFRRRLSGIQHGTRDPSPRHYSCLPAQSRRGETSYPAPFGRWAPPILAPSTSNRRPWTRTRRRRHTSRCGLPHHRPRRTTCRSPTYQCRATTSAHPGARQLSCPSYRQLADAWTCHGSTVTSMRVRLSTATVLSPESNSLSEFDDYGAVPRPTEEPALRGRRRSENIILALIDDTGRSRRGAHRVSFERWNRSTASLWRSASRSSVMRAASTRAWKTRSPQAWWWVTKVSTRTNDCRSGLGFRRAVA